MFILPKAIYRSNAILLLKIYLFILIGGKLLHNIVVVFAIHWHEPAMGVHVSPILKPLSHLPPHPISQDHFSALALSALSHASNLDWRSISQMVIYMFWSYSLKSSHPRLLPQSPKVCSLHLCLFCCLAYRVIVTIFLNSIYKCVNILYGWFSFWLNLLCIIGSKTLSKIPIVYFSEQEQRILKF